jgi:uncharacterized protein (TIGR02145 family)
MKSTFLITLALTLSFTSYTQLKDIDRNEYKTIKIGNQVWMAENLNVSHFKNGDKIMQAKTVKQWQDAIKEGIPAWCYYDNDKKKFGKKYAKLYNIFAVIDPRGLSPEGWHVADSVDYRILINYLGGDSIAGYKMKSKSGWLRQGLVAEDTIATNPNGSNESGFNGIPGGYRNCDCFSHGNAYGEWWTSSKPNVRFGSNNVFHIQYVSMWYSYEYGYNGILFGWSGIYLEEDGTFKSLDCSGFSVRCLKD